MEKDFCNGRTQGENADTDFQWQVIQIPPKNQSSKHFGSLEKKINVRDVATSVATVRFTPIATYNTVPGKFLVSTRIRSAPSRLYPAFSMLSTV
jgi:hypothetical protein